MTIRILLRRAMPICLAAFAFVGAAAEQIKVATPAKGLFELPIVIAMRNRYFTSEDLEIQKIQIQPDIAVRALISGEVHFNLDWEASVQAAASGVPIKVVTALVSRPMHVLVARPEIRSGRDLKGRTLGVDSFSSTTDYLSRVVARYLGVEPEKQISIVEIGNSADRLMALKAGDIHATAIDLAIAVKAQEEGFKPLLHIGDIIDIPMFGLSVTTANLSMHRERIKKFMRATLRGVRFINRNRSETVRIIQSYLKITPSQAGKSYDAAIRSFTENGLISDRSLSISVRRVRPELQFANDSLLTQVADWSVLREIMAERRKIPFWLKQYDP